MNWIKVDKWECSQTEFVNFDAVAVHLRASYIQRMNRVLYGTLYTFCISFSCSALSPYLFYVSCALLPFLHSFSLSLSGSNTNCLSFRPSLVRPPSCIFIYFYLLSLVLCFLLNSCCGHAFLVHSHSAKQQAPTNHYGPGFPSSWWYLFVVQMLPSKCDCFVVLDQLLAWL